MITKVLHNYKLLKELGHGGMGVVYLAEHELLKRKVAVKVLPDKFATNPSLIERFKREAGSMLELEHPSIVKLIHLGVEDNTYFIVMELVEGQSLRELLNKKEPLQTKQAVDIAIQCCEALSYAHEKGIIHRDIKPGNILIDREGSVKVSDFGLARIVGDEALSIGDLRTAIERGSIGYDAKNISHLTMVGTSVGTLDYMSPEQRAGEEGIDGRSDIYSLGVLLYEMITGNIPSGLEKPSEINPDVSKELDRIVSKALSSRKENRYDNVEAFKRALEQETGKNSFRKVPLSRCRKIKGGFLAVILVLMVAGYFGSLRYREYNHRKVKISELMYQIEESLEAGYFCKAGEFLSELADIPGTESVVSVTKERFALLSRERELAEQRRLEQESRRREEQKAKEDGIFEKGMAHYQAGEYGKAVIEFRQLLEINPEREDAAGQISLAEAGVERLRKERELLEEKLREQAVSAKQAMQSVKESINVSMAERFAASQYLSASESEKLGKLSLQDNLYETATRHFQESHDFYSQAKSMLSEPAVLTIISNGQDQIYINQISHGAFGTKAFKLQPGTYTIESRRSRYYNEIKSLVIGPGESKTVDIKCTVMRRFIPTPGF